ncbi:MAG: hypothetical protein WD355_11335 [Balneolaceae bacterium]
MTKMMKYGIIGLLLLIGTGFLILTLTIDSIVKSNIETIGTEMAGTPVTVDAVSISPFSGSGTISGFRIANPDGYQTDYALQVDDFQIELDIFTLWSDVITIHEIRINNPVLYVEQQLPGNNLRTLMNHFNDVAGSEPGSFGEIQIDYFLLQGGSVDLYTEIGGERSARVEMSEIEIRDLGRGGGEQYAEEVINEIAERVVQQALQAATRSGAEQIRDAIEGLFE